MIRWNSVENSDFPKDKDLMVVYLAPFFGGLDAQVTVACYNNEDDHEGDTIGWNDSHTDRNILVTHWAEVPEVPKDNPPEKLKQTEFLKEYSTKYGTVIKQ